ncbi:MAG TPA: CARDB domain-containing protein, partial [Polyangiaceae bacterium]|nr:CARDB domain-containing protein [Polyangiaceae bacterium]
PSGNDDVERNSLPNGLEVWGDPSDVWVAARRIWNQHAYHVTNVTEGGQIPLHEPESWLPLNGRLYDTYRSQPRNYGVAPDLSPIEVQISSPDVACGKLSDELQISVLVKNLGDLRVGPGVDVAFTGHFEGPREDAALLDDQGQPIVVTLTQSLEPGSSTIVSASYRRGNNGRDDLPAEIGVSVDARAAERECHEDNNEISGAVEAGAERADISLQLKSASGCLPATVQGTLTNDGSSPASDVLVRLYAGDPSQGGEPLAETTVAGPLAPGKTANFTVTIDGLMRDLTLYGIADPLDTISECNDANNRAWGPSLPCDVVR